MIETFTDTAFAFAPTLLDSSFGALPSQFRIGRFGEPARLSVVYGGVSVVPLFGHLSRRRGRRSNGDGSR